MKHLLLAALLAPVLAEGDRDAGARALLERAAVEIEQSPERIAEHEVVSVARGLAREDRARGVALARGLLARARAASLPFTAEYVALAMATLDRDLAREALESVRADPRMKRGGLKDRLLEWVVARFRGGPGTEEWSRLVEALSEARAAKVQIQNREAGVMAAEYATALDGALGAEVWEVVEPARAWRARYTGAKQRAFFRLPDASDDLLALLPRAPDPFARDELVRLLWDLGWLREEDFARLETLRPDDTGGWPGVALLERIARLDPARALRLEVRAPDRADRVLGVVARERPELLRGMIEASAYLERRANHLEAGLEALLRRGALAEARALAGEFLPEGERAVALALVGERARDKDLIGEALSLARSQNAPLVAWRKATRAAVRALGGPEARRHLVAACPELEGRWSEGAWIGGLVALAEDEPRWVMEAFLRGPVGPDEPRLTLGLREGIVPLMGRVAGEDPDFAQRYLDTIPARASWIVDGLKDAIALGIAFRSREAAEAFARRWGLLERHGSTIWQRARYGRIARAGGGLEPLLADLAAPQGRGWLLREAVTFLLDRGEVVDQRERRHRWQELSRLLGLLEDRSLADDSLAMAGPMVFGEAEAGEYLALADRIVRRPVRVQLLLAAAARLLGREDLMVANVGSWPPGG